MREERIEFDHATREYGKRKEMKVMNEHVKCSPKKIICKKGIHN